MAEEAFDNLVALTAVMFDAAPEPLVGVDSDGRIICWNRAAERTFGYDRTQATGQFLVELIVPARLREGHLRGFGRTNRTPGQELPIRTFETLALEPPMIARFQLRSVFQV